MRKPAVLIVALALVVIVMAIAFVKLLPRLAEQTPAQPTAEDVARNNRGVGLMGRYEYEEARLVFQQLADRHPDWHDVRVNLAIAVLNRQQDGDEELALSILDDVLAEQPDHLRAHYCSGLLRLYLHEPERAMEHLQFVAQHDPGDAYAAYYIAQSHAQNREFEQALEWYQRSLENDEYLRSAYYGKFQALQRLGRSDEAMEMLEAFERLKDNPRAKLVEFIYTRMGPKGEALAVGVPGVDVPLPPPPEGPIFVDPVPLLINGEDFSWRVRRPDRPVSITIGEFIFIPGVLDEPGLYNAVCIPVGQGRFALDPDHVLAGIPDVNAALWGDFDNDGFTDLYLLRRGPNVLLRRLPQAEPVIPGRASAGGWIDVTEETGTSGGDYDTVNGLFFDADHDGDLDIFLVNADGPNELLNNNMDGTPPHVPPTFTPIAQRVGIAGDGRPSRQVIAVDLENDRDLDIIVINDEPPHEVYLNDRLWQYRPGGERLDAIINARVAAMVAADLDADGWFELYGVRETDGHLQRVRLSRDERGVWRESTLADPPGGGNRRNARAEPALAIAIADVNGDARQNVMAFGDEWGTVWEVDRGLLYGLTLRGERLAGWTVAVLSETQGPAVIAMPVDGPPIIWHPGPGRYDFASLTFTGREDPGQAMRSNASGIGTHFAARIGTHWVAGSTLPNHSGPGQSLQPVAVGLAGHPQIDFVSIDWSDGIFQSEIDLAAGELHTISETQRQLASCPILFAWDGEKYEFVSDVLGVAGIGFALGPPGEYAPSRPWEKFLLPEGLLQPKRGRYVLKLAEPMEETCYLDSARLVMYDLPPGWKMTLDERMAVGEPEATGRPVFYRQSMVPVRAVNDRGEDVTDTVREVDGVAAPVPEHDLRFIGRLASDHVLTLTYPEPLDAHDGEIVLIIDGWIEYPYSQTMFSAWQAGAEYRAPTIEARAAGEPGHVAPDDWHIVWERFGYPAGMPRQMSVPIPRERLPDGGTGVTELRITTNQEIFWDRIKVAWAIEPGRRRGIIAGPRISRLTLVEATLIRSGFAQRVLFPQRRPYYDYSQRPPLWDTRHHTGWHTAFGPVLDLIRYRNGALAIFGPGEEIHMEFDIPRDRPIEGWTRRYVIEFDGWCKDMDLFTRDAETLDPLPGPKEMTDERERLHEVFNTRFESWRR